MKYHAIVEVKFHLIMNSIYNNTESRTVVQTFESREEAEAFYHAESVPVYFTTEPGLYGEGERRMSRRFREGPLMDYNPLPGVVQGVPFPKELDHLGHGIQEGVSLVQVLGPFQPLLG